MTEKAQCCPPPGPVLSFKPVLVAEHIESCRAHAASLSGLANIATQTLHTCFEYGPDEPHLGTCMDAALELLDQVHTALQPLGAVSHYADPVSRASEIAAGCEAQRKALHRARHLTLAVIYVLRSSEMDGTDEADEIIESLHELEEGIRLVLEGLLPAAMSLPDPPAS
ncbi:hypothetical protein [Steroidobacter agaridevorans]|uniref:hypothetical protein n=1 Tax=Steroidobacter agaridevorans TaxID=2695856 RepID=UPI00137AFBB4|nr:hypothetical protein [Steroidobacter agaridevorans]